MRGQATSTIARLLYEQRPTLNFARLVAEFGTALDDCSYLDRKLTWDHDDIAIFDIGGSRITISFLDELPGAHQSCLCVSVGHAAAAEDGPEAEIAERQGEMAGTIVSRISRQLPPDSVIWHKADHVVTPDLIDGLIETFHAAARSAVALAPVPDLVSDPAPELADERASEGTSEQAPALALGLPPRSAPGRSAVRRDDLTPDLIERLAKTADAHFEALNGKSQTDKVISFQGAIRARMFLRPTAVQPDRGKPITVANDLPECPDPRLRDAWTIRAALYAEEEDRTRSSVKLRLATHAINATLIVIALPVGISMMTYSLLRGENLTASARVLAIMGTLTGLQYTSVGTQVLAMF